VGKMTSNIHPILASFIPIVEGLGKTFGENCEVVLHNIKTPESSVIAVANGHVTGRVVGSPMTEVGLAAIRKSNFQNSILNYGNKTTDGRDLKSSTIFIKDEEGVVIGCLCINFDISEFGVLKKAINQLCFVEDKSSNDGEVKETLGNNVNEVLSNIVYRTLEKVGKPVAYMTKEEKVSIVKLLDEQGAFLIKGAIDYVAKVLCVSRYTIYNYLDEIRVVE
jgi:predicted transcriptional regulator YheO